MDNRIPKVGDAVRIVNEEYHETFGLVTAVHGPGYEFEGHFTPPLINAVYISADPAKRDPYGQQTERLSSLGHFAQTKNMPKAGRYWDFIS